MADEQSRIYPMTAREREALSISNGLFRRGVDSVTLGSQGSAYWQVVTPADTPVALLSRVLSTFDGGGIIYRVFLGSNATGTPVLSPIQIEPSVSEVTFQRCTGVTETGVTVPPVVKTDLITTDSLSDIDFVPESGTGNNSAGGAAGGQDFRPQPRDTTFYLHAYNSAAQSRTLTLELTWIVGKFAIGEINK